MLLFWNSAGPVNGPHKMQHIVDRNQETLNSFIKAVEELAVLRENLLKKEVGNSTFSFLQSCKSEER